MTRSALAAAIAKELKGQGTAERAAQEKRYLKSELIHFGVTVPKVRATVKRLGKGAERAEVLAAVKELWGKGVYELRSSAVELLVMHVGKLGKADVPLVEKMLREAKTWALVDFLAPHVAGKIADGRTLDRWATDDDFWLRRAALLALLLPLRAGAGDFARFGRYADAMLEEKEFFIRKAIGWVLREVSEKQPELVVDWLAPRAHRAAGLTVREATRHLSPAQRAKIRR